MQTPNLVSTPTKPAGFIGTPTSQFGSLQPIQKPGLVIPPKTSTVSTLGTGAKAPIIGTPTSQFGTLQPIGTAPKPAQTYGGLVTTNPNQAKIDAINSQIKGLQGQLTNANNAGYGGANSNIPVPENILNGQSNAPYFPPISQQPPQQAPQQPVQQPTQAPVQNGQVNNPTPEPYPATTPGNPYIAGLAGQNVSNNPEYNKELEAYNQAVQNLSQFKQGVAKEFGGIESQPIPLEFQQGREQVLSRQYAGQEAALQGAVNQQQTALGITQQGQNLAQQALGQATGFAQPQFPAYTSAQFNPAQGTYGTVGGGQFGSGPAAAANVASIQDLTGQASQIQSVFNGAEANFKLLVDTAKQGGVNDTNIPAINALQQNIARGLASSSAVINFQNTLATVRSQYAQILGGGTATVDSQHRAEEAIPSTISLGALQSLEQQLKAEATNRVAGINQQIKSLSGNQTNANQSTNLYSW